MSDNNDMNDPKKYFWTYEGMHEYEGMILPGIFPASSVEEARNFPYEEGDVIVCTYPKSGTAWMQEIVWLLHNDCDEEKREQEKLMMRVPNIDAKFGPESNATILRKRAPPRLIKTHYQAKIYEKAINEGKVKLVLVVRNPKDMLVSLFNFYKMQACFGNFPGPWTQFLDMAYNKELAYGDWFDHLQGYWNLRDKSNVLILTYEDMQKDTYKAVETVASFLGLNAAPDLIQNVVAKSSFNTMKANPKTNFQTENHLMDFSKSSYMRKGTVGDWKNYFTVAQSEAFDDMFEKKMKGIGLKILFEL